MRFVCSLGLAGALALVSLPAAVSAADLGPGAWQHAAVERPAPKPRRMRHSQRQRVAYSDCRTGWWRCHCDGMERRPVWLTRCR